MRMTTYVALAIAASSVACAPASESEEGEGAGAAIAASESTGYVMARFDLASAQVDASAQLQVSVGCPSLDEGNGEVVTKPVERDASDKMHATFVHQVSRPGRCAMRLSDGKRTGQPITVLATDHLVEGYNDFAVDAKLSLKR